MAIIMTTRDNLIKTWILFTILLVLSMILVGGYTRLTHSGLSIVQWKPVSGIIPPLNDFEWQEEFQLYQQSPEYKKVNVGITLTEFKRIFLVEYIHRLLGRITGLIFLVPLLIFSAKGFFNKQEQKYFFSIGGLIMLQGVVGWYMVKSGLIDNPSVSQYRLAAHLLLACLIVSLLAIKLNKQALSISFYQGFTIFLLVLQIFSGALVAGLKAGLVYNSFPLMDGDLIPDGLFNQKPIWNNFFENITMVQFNHRVLAIINLVNLLAYSYKIFKLKKNVKVALYIASLSIIQVTLGILTLIYQVPLILGLLHQFVAVMLLFVAIMSLKKG